MLPGQITSAIVEELAVVTPAIQFEVAPVNANPLNVPLIVPVTSVNVVAVVLVPPATP